ncbi:cytoplasmic dynein 2 intermediate chain 1 isoform X2 [Chironomus tepperi]
MNTIHNVTVSSPPSSAGKERSTSLVNIRNENENSDDALSQKHLKHSRSRTRTIAPEESILYQRKLISSKSVDDEKPKIERKNPVAYEINFEEEKKKAKKILKQQESTESIEGVKTVKKPLEKQKSVVKNEKVLQRQKTQDIKVKRQKTEIKEPSMEKAEAIVKNDIKLKRQKTEIKEPSIEKAENDNVHQRQAQDIKLKRQKTQIAEPSIEQEEEQSSNEEEQEENYESDFESYESDFEAEPSDETEENSTNDDDSDEDDDEIADVDRIVTDRVDSGSFDMSAKKSVTPSLNQYDSIEDTVNSHDSGISYDDLQAMNKRLVSPKVIAFYKRGEELMKKITFDSISFDVFEQKPIPYEVFMSIYGQRGMMQASTQCESLCLNEECQTEAIRRINSWTQYPSKFTRIGLENINSKQYNEEKLGVGDENFDYVEKDQSDSIEHIDMSIEAINNFSDENSSYLLNQQSGYVASDLRNFVQNASISIFNILEGKSSKSREHASSKIPICSGYFEINVNDIELLSNTIITKIWSNVCLTNFLITVHKVMSSSQNYMCLWNILHVSRPIKIFNAWSDIKCLEIHPHQRDYIIGGCSDGTICLWNIKENSDDLATFSLIQPSEIISLNQLNNDFALDNVAAIKSLSYRPYKNSMSMFIQSQSSQFCSLHENGFLSVWTLLQLDNYDDDVRKLEMNFTHNGSDVKLIKNMSIDMNQFLSTTSNENEKNVRKKSAFEKTRYYFENDLFSDKVLKELQEIDTDRLQRSKNFMYRNEMFTATSFDLNYNELFISSDTNFIVAMSRLCLGDKARKIITNDSNFISPSIIKAHSIDKNILAIGQTNGSVKFIKTSDDFNLSSSNKRKQLKRSNAAFNNDDNVLSKSCAFQNIVEREKKLYEETQALNDLESDEMKALLLNESLMSSHFEDNEENYKNNLKIAFDKNLFNSFDVCMGTVKLIEFNRTGQFMFVLINKDLKIFDCWKNVEIQNFDNRGIIDVKCIVGSDGNEYMVLLTAKKEVLVNKLKF